MDAQQSLRNVTTVSRSDYATFALPTRKHYALTTQRAEADRLKDAGRSVQSPATGLRREEYIKWSAALDRVVPTRDGRPDVSNTDWMLCQ